MSGSLFPVFNVSAQSEGHVLQAPVDEGETFPAGALVTMDTSEHVFTVCGTDPSLIAGVALGKAGALAGGGAIYPVRGDTVADVPVLLATPDMVFGFSSTTTPVLTTHLGVKYGVTVDSGTGYWQLDTSKTGGSARLIVINVDVAAGVFYARILTANVQFVA